MVLVELPSHLRVLANVDRQVRLDVPSPITQRKVLDALEQAYPTLSGTIRDRDSGRRRPLVRFFGCGEDLSNLSPDTPLHESIAAGKTPFIILGAIAGG